MTLVIADSEVLLWGIGKALALPMRSGLAFGQQAHPSMHASLLIVSRAETSCRYNPTSDTFDHTPRKRHMVGGDRCDPDMAASTIVGLEHQIALKVGKGQYARVADELASSLFRDVADHLRALSRLRDQMSHGFKSFCARAETPHASG